MSKCYGGNMEKAKTEVERVLALTHKDLMKKANVLNTRIATKITDGVDTGIECIRVYVSKKVDKKFLAKNDLVPKTIQGVPVDVVPFDNPGFEMGQTEPSNLPPEIQKRIASGVKKHVESTQCSKCGGNICHV